MRYTENFTNKLYQYFTGKMGLKASTKGFYRGDCPFCGSGYTFGVNFEKGKSNCFRCDEGKTTLINVIQYRENLDTLQEVKAYINLQEDYGFAYAPKVEKAGPVKRMELPPHYRLISMGDDIYARSARFYWIKKRGFRLKESVMAGIGFCDDGDYEGYIIIPYYVGGKLVYFTTRKFIGFGPKFKNPIEEDYGIGKTQVIYNRDALFIYDKGNIVESATNSLTLGPNTIGLGGKDMSRNQFHDLIKAPCSSYTLLLDPDAIRKAYEHALKLVDYKRVRVVHLPEGQDVNSYGRVGTKELIRDTPFMNAQELRAIHRNLPYE